MDTIQTICLRTIRIGFALLFILIPLILTPWNYELFEYNKMMAVYGLTIIITTAWLGTMVVNRSISIKKTPLDLPIILFLITQAIATVFSIDPHVSWFGYYSRFNGGMLSLISYTLLYYAFVSVIEKKELSRYIKLILGTAAVVSIYGVLEHFGIDKQLWVQDVQSRVFSTLGQPNWLGAYLTALLPLPLIMFLFAKEKPVLSIQKAVSLVLALLFFLTLLWTRSRSALLAFCCIDGVFLILGALYLKLTTHRSWKRALPILIPQLCFVGIIILNGIAVPSVDQWITIGGWQKRIMHLTQKTPEALPATEATASGAIAPSQGPALETGGTESGVIRRYVWEGALTVWKSTPKTILIGTGTETFAFAFYQFKPQGHNMTSEWDFLYNKAHNEYLNYLATTGILGLGSYLVLIGSIIIWFIKTYRKVCDTKKHETACMLPIALFLGWISILITNFFGFSVVIIQLFFFLFPAFWYLFLEDEHHTWTYDVADYVRIHTRPLVFSLLTIPALLLLFFLIRFWIGDTLFAQGYRLSRAGYMPQAYSVLQQSLAYNASEPLYHDEFSTVLASLALAAWNDKETTLAGELAKQSVQESDTALTISPNNVNFWKTRTKVLYTLSPMNDLFVTRAIEALEHAQRLSPLDPKIRYNLAILYGRVGRLDEGIDALRAAQMMKPDYRDAYYGLVVFYKEKNQLDLMRKAAQEYLDTVNPNDQDFLEVIQ